jgi:hypothetical protein
MKLRIPLLFSLTVSLFAVDRMQAQNIFAQIDGNWDSDIWSLSAGPVTPTPTLRPGSANTARLNLAGLDVVINTTVGVAGVSNGAAGNTLTINSGGNLTTTSSLANGSSGFLFTMNSGAQATLGAITLANGASTSGTAQINAGASVSTANVRVGQTGAGTLLVSGGTFRATAADNTYLTASSGTGTVTINSGGVFQVDGILRVTGNTPSGVGTVNLQSGSLIVSGALLKGTGSSTFNWSGGNLSAGSTDLVTLSNAGTGTLLVGGASTVGTFVLEAGASTAYTQGSTASMTLDFASDVSFDTIGIGAGTALTVNLDGTVNLNLLAGYIPTVGETFDVITATSIVDNTFVLGGNGASYFTYEIVDLGATEVLRLTAVPEPATSLLVAAAGMFGLVLRRRR